MRIAVWAARWNILVLSKVIFYFSIFRFFFFFMVLVSVQKWVQIKSSTFCSASTNLFTWYAETDKTLNYYVSLIIDHIILLILIGSATFWHVSSSLNEANDYRWIIIQA